MKFEKSSSASGSEELVKALTEDIVGQKSKLSLAQFCGRGGWPVDEEIGDVTIIEDDGKSLVVTFSVSFNESAADCCSGDICEYPRYEKIRMVISKSDWIGSFDIAD